MNDQIWEVNERETFCSGVNQHAYGNGRILSLGHWP